MSMNFSQKNRAVLLASIALFSTQGAVKAQANSYYQKVSINTVLKTKPAMIYVSPRYQVTLVVNSREITGVSLELSKQKLFSVTLADNHHMIFLDSLTNKGGADLNLILDDDTVLPIHLAVKDAPTGTRVYTFFDASDSAAEAATPLTPAATGQPAPVRAAQVPTTQAARTPARPRNRAIASQNAAASFTATSSVAQIPSTSLAALPSGKTAAQMNVQVSKKTGGKVSLAFNLTAPGGQAIRAELANLKLSDGKNTIPFTIEKAARGRLLPITAVVSVKNAPAQMYVQWPVNSIFPAQQYLLTTTVRVN